MGNQISDIRVAVKAIKEAILQSQLRVAENGNKELLTLYYGIGRYVSYNSRHGFWGTGAIRTISEQLQKNMPGLRGFGVSNIRNMRQFYEEWEAEFNSPALAGKLDYKSPATDGDLSEDLIVGPLHLNNTTINIEEFTSISFSHHMEIINKAKSLDERCFYIHQTHVGKWDKYTLRDMLVKDLYHNHGAMANNFIAAIPDKAGALKAIEMFRDEYLLDFINTEELGARDATDVDERVLEQHIIHNVKNFIMTFGHDFTFVGNQYHLEKYGHDLYPDLLFFNRELACLVAVELKRGDFKPAYLGQLSAYLRVLDSEVKKPFENPSIGIVLCKNADKSFVQFLIQGYDNPMGVAVYKTKEDIMRLLPPEEELIKIMEE